MPVVLVGMEDIAKRIRSQDRYSRFRRRITQWLDFTGLSLEDTANVARELCEVEIRDDLVNRLHAETKGNIGAAVVGIGKIERYAFTNSLPSIGLKEYGNRPLN